MCETHKKLNYFLKRTGVFRPNGNPSFQVSNYQLRFSKHSFIDILLIYYWFICCSTKKWTQWHVQTFIQWPSAPHWFAPTWLPLKVNLMRMTPLRKRRQSFIRIGTVMNALHCAEGMHRLSRFWCARLEVFAKSWFALSRFNVSKLTSTGKAFAMDAKPWNVVHLLHLNPSPWKPWFKCRCASYRTWRTPFRPWFSHSCRKFTASFAHCINACCCSNNTRSRTVAHSPRILAGAIVHHAAMASATNATKATAAARANATTSASASAAMHATKAPTNNASATAPYAKW